MADRPSRLSEVARHVVIPEGIVTTAWPRVVDQCERMGVTFDAWQHGIGAAALGKRDNGKYAATVGGVVLSIPRQVGKTFLVGMIVVALCILNPGLTVLWTAHRTRTASKTFGSLKALTSRKRIKPFMLEPRNTNGEQEIRFRNGSVIMFGAREQGFGRGFDEVDVEVFDEAQILTEKALEDMVPSANQSRQPSGALLFFMGTPPRPNDDGAEFTNRREKALSGRAPDMLYVEFSADDDADPDDRDQWRKANPSFPSRTPVESMLRMREQLTDDASFLREALGIWGAADDSFRVIHRGPWTAAGDPESQPVERLALGIEVAPDQLAASVALAGLRADGRWHVELDERRESAGWVAGYVEALVAANPELRTVVVDVAGPVQGLVEQRGKFWRLTGTRVRVLPVKVQQLGAGCQALLAGINAGEVAHLAQPQLTAAVSVVGRRPLGDTGMWVWSRRNAAADITPVQAATLALIGAQAGRVTKPAPTGTLTSEPRRRRAVVLS